MLYCRLALIMDCDTASPFLWAAILEAILISAHPRNGQYATCSSATATSPHLLPEICSSEWLFSFLLC